MSTATKVWSLNDIQAAMRADGSHWWDPGTMRFFGTRVCGPAWNGPKGVFFVTSEKPPHGPRGYTIRQFIPPEGPIVAGENCTINTVGELCGYKTRETAIRHAREMAGAGDFRTDEFQPVTDFDQFLYDLAHHGCPDVRPSQARELIRLGKRYGSLMEQHCNGRELYDEDSEPLPILARLRKRIEDLAANIGCKGVRFQGDPRGCTVKLQMTDGYANDWGKEGFCVPGA